MPCQFNEVKIMRTFLVLSVIFLSAVSYAAPKGALENPQPNDYASGIYLFSGWVCEAEIVQIGLDGVQLLHAAYGSDRLDTLSTCGDADNGFGILVNMANLAAGNHQATLYADGQQIAQSTFKTAALSTGEFSDDLVGCAVSQNFPASGSETVLQWTTSQQGFQVEAERAGLITDSIQGVWLSDYLQASIWVFREGCGPLSVFVHGDLTDADSGKDVMKMTGLALGTEIALKSTAVDGAEREATMTIRSSEEILLAFTNCGPLPDEAYCDFTPAGGQIILNKVPSILGQDSIKNDTVAE